MTKPDPAAAPASKAECADCHHKFTDRLETQWDVHMPDGTYIVVCSPCFQKRDAARATEPDDKPVAGSTAVWKTDKKAKPKKK